MNKAAMAYKPSVTPRVKKEKPTTISGGKDSFFGILRDCADELDSYH